MTCRKGTQHDAFLLEVRAPSKKAELFSRQKYLYHFIWAHPCATRRVGVLRARLSAWPLRGWLRPPSASLRFLTLDEGNYKQ